MKKYLLIASLWFSSTSVSLALAEDGVCHLNQIPHSVYGSSPISTYFLLSLLPEKVVGLNFPQDKAGMGILPDGVFKLPIIGGWFGQGQMPNKETLMSVAPELTILSKSGNGTGTQKQKEMLNQLQLPYCELTLETMDDYPAAYRQVGAWLGVAERGELLARFSQTVLERLQQARTHIQQPKRVYYAEGNDGLATECKGSLHAEVLEQAGAENTHVCEAVTGFGMVKVNLEQVLAENPEVIVTQDQHTFAFITHDARWQSVAAVKQGHVLLMPNKPWRWMDRPPSLTRFVAAPWLMHQLYPELLSKTELSLLTTAFFKQFFNHTLTDDALAALLTSSAQE